MGVKITTTSEYTCDNCGAIASTTVDGAFQPQMPEGWVVVSLSGAAGSMVQYLDPPCQGEFRIPEPGTPTPAA